MNSQVNEPPLGRPGLLLIALYHVIRTAEVVAADAVADRPASRTVRVILDRELLRLTALFTRACRIALNNIRVE